MTLLYTPWIWWEPLSLRLEPPICKIPGIRQDREQSFQKWLGQEAGPSVCICAHPDLFLSHLGLLCPYHFTGVYRAQEGTFGHHGQLHPS